MKKSIIGSLGLTIALLCVGFVVFLLFENFDTLLGKVVAITALGLGATGLGYLQDRYHKWIRRSSK